MREIPAHVPPGYDLIENLARVEDLPGGGYPSLESMEAFKELVQSNGEWDYKQGGRQFQDFGNWNYKMMANHAGIPSLVARAFAGLYQIYRHTSSWSFYSSYGDDPRDQAQMDRADRVSMGLDHERVRSEAEDVRSRTWADSSAMTSSDRLESPRDDVSGFDRSEWGDLDSPPDHGSEGESHDREWRGLP